MFNTVEDKYPIFFEHNPYTRENITVAEGNEHIVYSGYFMGVSSTTYPNDYLIPDYYADEIVIEKYTMINNFDKTLNYSAEAEVSFKAVRDGFHWIRFTLDGNLDLSEIKNENGNDLYFYKPEESGEVWVKLPQPAELDKIYTFNFKYKGDVVERGYDYATGQNEMVYIDRFLVWYPRYDSETKFYKHFENTFIYPESFVFSTIGDKVEEHEIDIDGKDFIKSKWVTEKPAKHSLFNVAPFMEKKIEENGIDFTIHHLHSKMWEDVKIDLVRSYDFYSQFFGELDFDEVYLTEIPWSHGQAAPGFVHLSQYAFLSAEDDGSLESFVSHEVAHQWWGLEVGWDSYHDAWISEGFAEYSSLMYLQYVFGNSEKTMDILEETKDRLITASRLNTSFQTKPSGIIQLGQRNGRLADGRGYQMTVYEKGAWVLHMIRNMLIDFYKNDETIFNNILKDFFATYRGKNAKIKDFEQVVAKHVGQDVTWFFDQWLRDWRIPTYRFAYKQVETDDGKFKITVNIKQEEVPENFMMSIPLKIVYENGQMDILRINMTGKEAQFDLPLLAFEVDEIEFNAFNSVLCEVKDEKFPD